MGEAMPCCLLAVLLVAAVRRGVLALLGRPGESEVALPSPARRPAAAALPAGVT